MPQLHDRDDEGGLKSQRSSVQIKVKKNCEEIGLQQGRVGLETKWGWVGGVHVSF